MTPSSSWPCRCSPAAARRRTPIASSTRPHLREQSKWFFNAAEIQTGKFYPDDLAFDGDKVTQVMIRPVDKRAARDGLHRQHLRAVPVAVEQLRRAGQDRAGDGDVQSTS